MILELDLGNTRCKWRILNAEGMVGERGDAAIADWLAGSLPPSWNDSIKRVRIASVLSPDAEQALAMRLSSCMSIGVEWARSSRSCAGVTNAYAEPGRLGVDRWLALVAAYRECHTPVLVADIGSALTIDLVDGAGIHRGGYIIPGPRLMGSALLQSTDRVRFKPEEGSSNLDVGRSTADCVHNGIAVAVAGAVLLARNRAEVQVGSVTALLAGGYAPALIDNLKLVDERPWRWRPDLVLDGLRWVLP